MLGNWKLDLYPPILVVEGGRKGQYGLVQEFSPQRGWYRVLFASGEMDIVNSDELVFCREPDDAFTRKRWRQTGFPL